MTLLQLSHAAFPTGVAQKSCGVGVGMGELARNAELREGKETSQGHTAAGPGDFTPTTLIQALHTSLESIMCQLYAWPKHVSVLS